MNARETRSRSLLHQFLIDTANQPRNDHHQSEDCVLVDTTPDIGLLGIFDAVGGRDHGQLVSHLASKTIQSSWHSFFSEEEHPTSLVHLELCLQRLIKQADTAIASLVLPPSQKRPATTTALALLSKQQDQVVATVAHIGDSRIYLLRSQQSLQRLTQDNGYFPFAVRRGMLIQEESWRIEQAEQSDDLSPIDQVHFAKRHQITCAAV